MPGSDLVSPPFTEFLFCLVTMEDLVLSLPIGTGSVALLFLLLTSFLLSRNRFSYFSLLALHSSLPLLIKSFRLALWRSCSVFLPQRLWYAALYCVSHSRSFRVLGTGCNFDTQIDALCQSISHIISCILENLFNLSSLCAWVQVGQCPWDALSSGARGLYLNI